MKARSERSLMDFANIRFENYEEKSDIIFTMKQKFPENTEQEIQEAIQKVCKIRERRRNISNEL